MWLTLVGVCMFATEVTEVTKRFKSKPRCFPKAKQTVLRRSSRYAAVSCNSHVVSGMVMCVVFEEYGA